MTDLVYVACHDVDWTPDKDEDEDAAYPGLAPNNLVAAGCVPRTGDYFMSYDKPYSWWRVERVTWSNFANTIVPAEVRRVAWFAWVDLTCRLITTNPRVFASLGV